MQSETLGHESNQQEKISGLKVLDKQWSRWYMADV